ncbi:hypothetical protein [Haloparvum sp. PAK95]|uniref:hypothetical protein n=1 Tax=Haloparvum sp. PAK95 TaxID=3418962 RepID=UPI003D2EEB08
MRARPALLVVVMLLLAGCAAPVAAPTNSTAGEPAVATDAPSTPDATANATNASNGSATNATGTPADPASLADTYDIEVDEADRFAEPPALVFARMAVLTNETAALPPERIQVFPDGRMQLGSGAVPRFQRLLGITYPDREGLAAAGYVDGPDRIVVNEAILDNETTTEAVLAHEAVHIIQFEQQAFSITSSRVNAGDLRGTTDSQLAYRATIEGSAVYATDAYHEAYMDTGVPPRTSMEWRYENASGATRLALGPYHYGSEHVAARADDAGDLRTVYEQPPRTTSEVIHGVNTDRPPVASLPVDVREGDAWTERSDRRDRLGELYFRVALATELDDETAATAGTGWRADKRLTFDDGENRSYVWVLRFADEPNATQAERAMGDYLDARGEPKRVDTANGSVQVWTAPETNATFRTVRVDDETVALVVGDSAFTAETTVTAERDGGAEKGAAGVVVRTP